MALKLLKTPEEYYSRPSLTSSAWIVFFCAVAAAVVLAVAFGRAMILVQ